MKEKPVVVAVSGAFDPIHVGHVRYIREAAKLGDRLVVILNGDDFLLRKKGFVFMSFAERKEILENIKGVDRVIASIDDDQTVRRTLRLLKPAIFAKGGDSAPGNIPEVETCKELGCQVVVNVGGAKVGSKADVSRVIKERGMEEESVLRVTCPYCADHPILREKCTYCKGVGKIEVEKAE
jgi:cytidyltransferase-like protein